MARALQQEYYPAPVPTRPEDLPRYLEQEFYKLRESLIAQPVSLTVSETSIIDVSTVPDWQRLYIGEEASWDVPGGTWDSTVAEWTCPQTGLYDITADTRVSPFGAGNKFYYAGLALLILTPDLTLTRFETTDGGDDSVPLGVTMTFLLPVEVGTRIYFESTVVHDQFSGTVTADSSAQLIRVSK